MREAEIAAAWLVPLPRLHGTIKLVDYDQAWPDLHAREEERIHAELGDRVLRLEHTGSTSVPGLAAKPRIDRTLTVTS